MFEFMDGRQLFLDGLRVAPVRQRADFDPVSRLARNLTGDNTYVVAFVFKLPGNSARFRISAIGRDLNHPHLLRRWFRWLHCFIYRRFRKVYRDWIWR